MNSSGRRFCWLATTSSGGRARRDGVRLALAPFERNHHARVPALASLTAARPTSSASARSSWTHTPWPCAEWCRACRSAPAPAARPAAVGRPLRRTVEVRVAEGVDPARLAHGADDPSVGCRLVLAQHDDAPASLGTRRARRRRSARAAAAARARRPGAARRSARCLASQAAPGQPARVAAHDFDQPDRVGCAHGRVSSAVSRVTWATKRAALP